MVKIRDNIWIGNNSDSHDMRVIKKNGITAILNVAHDAMTSRAYSPDEFRAVKFNLGDYRFNRRYFKELAVYTLKLMLYHKEKVLVHCAVGLSRSVYVVTQALADLEDKPANEVFEEIKSKHPGAMYGPLFANM